MKYVLSLIFAAILASPACFATDLSNIQQMPTKFKIVSTRHCMFGDFDLALHDYAYKRGEFKLFFAIKHLESDTEYVFPILESMFKDRTVPWTESVAFEVRDSTRNFMQNGFEVQVVPELLAADGTYELRVCSDSSPEPSCFQGKKVEDIGELLKQYQDPPASYISADHIYYGQMVIKNGPSTLWLNDSVNETNALRLAEKRESARPRIDEMTKLRSLPLRVEGDAFLVVLPSFSPKKCGMARK